MKAPTKFLRIRIFILAASSTVSALGQATVGSAASQPGSASPVTSATEQTQALFFTFQKEQLTLARQEQSLEQQGATSAQLTEWSQQNAPAFALQRQRLKVLALAAASAPQNENRMPTIPPGASTALVTYLTARTNLTNERAHIRNQLLEQAKSSGTPLTSLQVFQIDRQANTLFEQTYSAELALLVKDAKANLSVQPIRPVPTPVVIPAGATPQMAAYLTAKNELRHSEIALMNEFANATPAERNAALRQWTIQNASQIEQLRQAAQTAILTTTTN